MGCSLCLSFLYSPVIVTILFCFWVCCRCPAGCCLCVNRRNLLYYCHAEAPDVCVSFNISMFSILPALRSATHDYHCAPDLSLQDDRSFLYFKIRLLFFYSLFKLRFLPDTGGLTSYYRRGIPARNIIQYTHYTNYLNCTKVRTFSYFSWKQTIKKLS